MIKNKIFIFLFLLLSVKSSLAQFIDIQITIEPELSATVLSDLNFGQLLSNSGESTIELGSRSMGIFSINGFKNQRVYLDVDYPDSLSHQDPLINASIPISINLSVNNTGINDYRSSFPINQSNSLVKLHDQSRTESPTNSQDVWEIMYLYVYGSITIGNIPNGRYQGDIYLSVEYD